MTRPFEPVERAARVPLRVRLTGWALAIFALVHAAVALVAVVYGDRLPLPSGGGEMGGRGDSGPAFALAMLVAMGVGLIATGVSAWIISGIALRSLAQLQSFAERLSADTIPTRVVLGNDGPEVEELGAELTGAMGRLEKAYESQARFLANVSHELKTPISVMRTEAEVMLGGSPGREELLDFARSVSDEADRLGRMIESFLLLTRVRGGASRIRLRAVDANELLMDAVSGCAAMAEQYGVRLVPTLDDSEEPPSVRGNADLLSTAVGNLLRNAIRFSPRGRAIDISCSASGDAVTLAVRDRGPGIPEDLLGRIFEPFTQAADERRRGRGTGLGLQIAQGIAELHGGEIEASNAETGCVFELRLPTQTSTDQNNAEDERVFMTASTPPKGPARL